MPMEEVAPETMEIEFEGKVIETLRRKATADRRTVSAQLNTILDGLFHGGNRYVTQLDVQEMVRDTIVAECRKEGSFTAAMRAFIKLPGLMQQFDNRMRILMNLDDEAFPPKLRADNPTSAGLWAEGREKRLLAFIQAPDAVREEIWKALIEYENRK